MLLMVPFSSFCVVCNLINDKHTRHTHTHKSKWNLLSIEVTVECQNNLSPWMGSSTAYGKTKNRQNFIDELTKQNNIFSRLSIGYILHQLCCGLFFSLWNGRMDCLKLSRLFVEHKLNIDRNWPVDWLSMSFYLACHPTQQMRNFQ